MEDQIQTFIRKTNKWSIVSLVTGVIAIAPYLVWIFGFLLARNSFTETMGELIIGLMIVQFILLLFVGGIAFGLISLITGGIAIVQIRNGQGIETGFLLGLVGNLLGILGIIGNILFGYQLYIGLLMRD